MCCVGGPVRRSERYDTGRRVVCLYTGIASESRNVSLGQILATASVVPNPTAHKVGEVLYRELEVESEERTTVATVTDKKPRTFGGATSHVYVIKRDAPGNLGFNCLSELTVHGPRVTVDQNGAYSGIASRR